jgi:hypothetical protein
MAPGRTWDSPAHVRPESHGSFSSAKAEQAMNRLVKKFWKLAVITLEEDGRLNKLSKLTFKTPDE